MSAEVALHRGASRVVVQGGPWLTLRSWTAGGVERLAAADAVPPDYRVHGARAGVTLLHPWANRVTADAFAVAGREVRLGDVPRDPDGVAIHGLPGNWAPVGMDERACLVERAVAATDAFPFAHAVRVEVVLGDADVTVTTTVTAGEDGPLPVAFGWHPYFPLPRPRREVVLGLPWERAPLGDRTFDDGFADVAATTWSIGDVAVEQDAQYGFAQVFAPADCDVVSLEPMTAPTDALRTGDGLRVLPPGAALSATFALRAR